MDGRGFQGPGLDHGVFIPFRLMFGEDFHSVPIVQASIDGSLSPERNWSLGKAITKLRCVHFSKIRYRNLLRTRLIPYS